MIYALTILFCGFLANGVLSSFGIAVMEEDNLVSATYFAIRSYMLIAGLIQRLREFRKKSNAEQNSAPTPLPSAAQQ